MSEPDVSETTMVEETQESGPVNGQPLLVTLKKGWTKGVCTKFLKARLNDYKAGVLMSNEGANSVLDNIVNQWFKTFHWSVPIPKCGKDNETTPPFPLFPTTSDGFKILSPADSALKGKVIEHMRREGYTRRNGNVFLVDYMRDESSCLRKERKITRHRTYSRAA
ncbi:uncharacterized protein LACBIDRAFT_328509 [Laccaria bicolor S238N-H82]|uniref:Predicted protein n=1 Tax=Laccaria bicolor (strain S238N-H82 / ATCC MYA-4686) TaxID=486041 RepID=B0DF27_LACBS|nr:uncharacterized protein LACBIDRAFT_328509 [Laccaria bicolor S238N-H82]EDR06777.1 predicted protein [Laccaria bicolor S238N-H82]|eukprot:XP_001882624.1 predicted protein [Laccaria bicolor S238N-H82]